MTLPLHSFAKEQTITLKDGSVIKGNLTQMSNGIYTVKTDSLGETQINAEQIASINNAQENTPTTPQNPKIQMDHLQQRMMNNPAMMAEIQQIAADPEVVQLLSNPAMLQAVMSKDVAALQNNPSTEELMNNPKIQSLIQKLQEEKQQSTSE